MNMLICCLHTRFAVVECIIFKIFLRIDTTHLRHHTYYRFLMPLQNITNLVDDNEPVDENADTLQRQIAWTLDEINAFKVNHKLPLVLPIAQLL